MNTRNFDFTGVAGQRLSGRLDLPDTTPVGYAVFAHCFTCSKNSTTPAVRAVATLAAPFDVQHITGHLRDQLQTILEQGEARVTLGERPFTVRRNFVEDLDKHDQAARIAGLRRPLLILHSPFDDTVDISNATCIFMAAKHPKSFVSLDDADHLLTRPQDAKYAAEVIAAWASRYLA